jgi:hypothetical protein
VPTAIGRACVNISTGEIDSANHLVKPPSC